MAGIVRLSRKLHETLGDDLAEELEASFDHVDAMNRATFRELFDVKLDQRLTEAKADLRQEISAVRQEVAELRGDLRAGLAAAESRLIKWMFLFWVGTIGITIVQKL